MHKPFILCALKKCTSIFVSDFHGHSLRKRPSIVKKLRASVGQKKRPAIADLGFKSEYFLATASEETHKAEQTKQREGSITFDRRATRR